MKVWKYLVKVRISERKKRKIIPNTIDAIFIGYAFSNTNRILVINSKINEISNNTIIRDATYFEDIAYFKTRLSSTISSSNYNDFSASSLMNPQIEVEPLKKREREREK